MIRLSAAAAACVLALSSTSALASAQSSVTLGSVSFTLIDLNPLDGIAPSFSFLSSAGSTLLNVSATEEGLGTDSFSRERVGTYTFSRDFLTDLVNASASGSIDGHDISLSGSALTPNTSYSADAFVGSLSAFNLSLSANTLLLIQADASLLASSTFGDSASATASLSLSYSYGSVSFADTKTLSAVIGAEGGSQSVHDFLSSAFVNTSGETQKGVFSLSASVAGESVTPIPEPETYALAIAGLCVAGSLARRRRG